MDLRILEVSVAENANTPIEVLAKLASHEHTDVRIALTDNPAMTAEILLLLAVDDNVDVRYSLAENHNAPPSVLSVLCDDENPYVAYRAGKTLDRLRHSGRCSTICLPISRQRKHYIG